MSLGDLYHALDTTHKGAHTSACVEGMVKIYARIYWKIQYTHSSHQGQSNMDLQFRQHRNRPRKNSKCSFGKSLAAQRNYRQQNESPLARVPSRGRQNFWSF
mmetsp:Transcript_128450/g.222689  ORF Transcript_128450/g.222689 Transcript_128450/m.222689 type:complete len:102 (-) Transcript_128450:13-318(-)